MKRHLAIVGFMAAGKSKIGRRLARELQWKFFDTDLLVERDHGPIATIFLHEGEAGFREYETRVLKSIVTTPQPCVIALGGGALTVAANRELIESYAHRIFIKAALQQILTRVSKSRQPRPMLGRNPTLESITALYNQRLPHYAQAECVVEAARHGDMLAEIVQWLRKEKIALAP